MKTEKKRKKSTKFMFILHWPDCHCWSSSHLWFVCLFSSVILTPFHARNKSTATIDWPQIRSSYICSIDKQQFDQSSVLVFRSVKFAETMKMAEKYKQKNSLQGKNNDRSSSVGRESRHSIIGLRLNWIAFWCAIIRTEEMIEDDSKMKKKERRKELNHWNASSAGG